MKSLAARAKAKARAGAKAEAQQLRAVLLCSSLLILLF
jgi:hypothetical protein